MGKKQIKEVNQEEAIKEEEKIQAKLKKEAMVSSSKRVPDARVYVSSSYNNTIITLTNEMGRVLATASAGAVGFKGTKKSTSFAASRVAESIIGICKKLAVERAKVFVKGVGAGRESALRTLVGRGLPVVAIKDITPIPHNGCRPKKTRRV